MKNIFIFTFVLFLFISGNTVAVSSVYAHRSGCHNLHSCPSDSNGYVCGDLGYPCDGTTSVENVQLEKVNVPLLVDHIFIENFKRKPTEVESNYWKKRFRSDKESIYQVRRAMAWHRINESFGPKDVTSSATDKVTAKEINALFRAIYDGRDPSVSENIYWISRLKDKPAKRALLGGMEFHKVNGIQH